MITEILAGIAAKLAELGLAAKVGTGIAAATLATAGVATVAPIGTPGAPAGAEVPGVEVQIPSIPPAHTDFGLNVAADATSGQASANAQAGLDTARQTPAGANVPASVPTRPAAAGAAQSGLDVARQTPAADRLPAFVPGPPASVPPTTGAQAGVPTAPPANLPPAAAAGSAGIDTATQTPGGQHIPPFVKGMVGRSN